MPNSWMQLLGIIVIINSIITLLYEKLIVPKLVFRNKV